MAADIGAYQTKYRQELILGFEDRQSRLRSTVVTEADVNGNQAIFLVSDSGSATATTRGADGLLVARDDSHTQNTATLAEWHDLVRKTRFNIFASQGNQLALMQTTSVGVINRKIDDDIIAALDGATNDTGAATTANLNTITKALTILGDNTVDIEEEDKMFALVSPGFRGELLQIPEYSSGDYVEVKPLVGPARSFYRWAGFNWIVHPRLTGSVGAGGTGASEKCYFYHQDSIGHAIDKEGLDTAIGYDDEQDYSYCRMSTFMGSVKLQNKGIVQYLHDNSGNVAS
ncbi:MAG TPA: phage capsid protein [Phycisphaerae bacterium]|nr:phage capsid protein [Phycisphaerae bacterium]